MYIPRNRTFWAVGLAHMTNDVFMSMGIVVLTYLSVSILPMSNTQIGFTVTAAQLIGALSQPAFGVMADRRGGRWVGTIGLATTVGMFLLSLILAVLTRNYWLMFIPYVLRGLGSGAVHPVGSLHSAEADKERAATNMSYFFLLGQIGLALGPALGGFLLDVANPNLIQHYSGLTPTIPMYSFSGNVTPILIIGVLAVPGVLLFMATNIPLRQLKKENETGETTESAPKKSFAQLPIFAFAILGILVITRSLATPGSVSFIPRLFQQKGWSPAEYGLITSTFWIASGISGVYFGQLADRFDRRFVVMGSLLASAPAFFLLPLVNGLPAFALAIAAGGFSGGSHSIIVVLAQDLSPANKGFASGAILGFIFGAGALGSLVIGTLSDLIGIGPTFQIVAVLTVVSAFTALLLPSNRPVNQPNLATSQAS